MNVDFFNELFSRVNGILYQDFSSLVCFSLCRKNRKEIYDFLIFSRTRTRRRYLFKKFRFFYRIFPRNHSENQRTMNLSFSNNFSLRSYRSRLFFKDPRTRLLNLNLLQIFFQDQQEDYLIF